MCVFKRADKFIGCNEALETMFIPANGKFYRVVHNPLQDNDSLVQSEQHFEGLAPSMSDLPETIEKGSSVEVQYDHIKGWSLSFNISERQLADNYWKYYKKRNTDSQRANYVMRKGDSIACYQLTPEAGLVQKDTDDDGHTVLVEYDDFTMEDYRDKEYGFKSLKDFEDEHK